MVPIFQGWTDIATNKISAYSFKHLFSKKSESEKRFDYCITVILSHEGGLTNNKLDPGGITDYGISLRFLRQVGLNIDDEPAIDDADIKALTKPEAISIYREYWWDKYNYAQLEHIEIVSKLFDLSVNMGESSGVKILQRSINRLQANQIAVDGILGKKTILAANTNDPIQLREQMRWCAKEKYLTILSANPAMEWCRNGWLNRAAW